MKGKVTPESHSEGLVTAAYKSAESLEELQIIATRPWPNVYKKLHKAQSTGGLQDLADFCICPGTTRH